ncbi:putative tyrosine protein kinase [Armadillidium vulgare iridescent virus]|uniref:Putative tyrosine protein kinase n=1 Tax=Armadillidium vulgare iridescent virus TaxID=72201 RepID=A0A068QL18_9VIRU|nr:putative tyrosine protein kinase [Armadillidium vulgare iridescent virus]CCV02395.1 putative tyrosine protein kinase [Armadillidium vulgare iridescent virus]
MKKVIFFIRKKEMTCIDPKELWPEEVRPNDRYKLFKQTFFTAGDEEQFINGKSTINRERCEDETILEIKNRWDLEISDFSLPGKAEMFSQSATSTMHTFQYLFHKFKKGIFVKILNNKVETFLPFSKHGFVNNWGHLMKQDPKFSSLPDFMRYISDETSNANDKHYRFRPEQVSKFPSQWYANNCLIRYEHPISEGDTNVTILRHMFDELCSKRKIPDIEFFINRRDFPLLMKDKVSEPYFHIFGKNYPMEETFQSKIQEGIAPILSMCTSDLYSDIVIPTHEDWARVESTENGILFPPSCKDYPKNFDMPWSKRKPTAVFRGGSTGCGVSSSNNHLLNQRLLAAKISSTTKPDKYEVPLIDAGITKWNLRPRKIQNEEYLKTINFKTEARKVSPLSPEQQATYKYLINIDGHVSAFRLSLEMNMGCCILLVDSLGSSSQTSPENGWKMWFFDKIKPYIHFVPVKSDLSDLIEKIQWCRDNDEECKLIAENAKQFYKDWLSKESILDYLQSIFIKIRLQNKVCVVYGEDPLQTQMIMQKEFLLNKVCLETEEISGRMPTPRFVYTCLYGRKGSGNGEGRPSYGWLKGFNLYLRHVSDLTSQSQVSKAIFKNKKSSVDLYMIGEAPVVVKTSSDKHGMLEHINEAFISETCLNKLIKVIPNFAMSYTVNIEKDRVSLYNELIVGETLSVALKDKFGNMTSGSDSEKVAFKRFLEVLVQIMFALEYAQDQCGFIHNDLAPWNIMIQTLKNPVTIEYPLESGSYKIITKHIPVMIDYGKSHVVSSSTESPENSIHFGVTNMFEMIWKQDIFSFVIMACLEMIKNEKEDRGRKMIDDGSLCHMLNFFRKENKKLTTRRDALVFIYKYKKYADIINAFTKKDDGELDMQDKRPLDFIKWCNGPILIPFLKTGYGKGGKKKRSPFMDVGNPRQIFDQALAPNEMDHSSYLGVPERLYRSTLPQPNTKFELYFVAQSLFRCLENTLNDYKLTPLKNKNFNVFHKAIDFIVDFYSDKIQNHLNDVWTFPQDSPMELQYQLSRNLLVDPKATEAISVPNQLYTDLSYFKNMVYTVFQWESYSEKGKIFELDEKTKSELSKELEPVLKSNLDSKKIVADNNTLFTYLGC